MDKEIYAEHRSRRLPPLNALRAFEAAARLGGFVEAARELNVTASAVSQQVKQLEGWLGVPLFERLARGLQATDAARDYLPTLSECLDRMEKATATVMRGEGKATLTVSMLPSFAAQWVVPRIHHFQEARPEIELRIAAAHWLVDFEREDIDLALRYGPGPYPKVHAERLMDEVVMPVCSPRLMDGPHPPRRLADLAHHVLLHDDGPQIARHFLSWESWLRAVGYDGPAIDTERGPVFSDSHLTVRAAVAGRGVMLSRYRLVQDELAAGALIAPMGEVLPASGAYWLVGLPETMAKPKARAFRDWVLKEVAEAGPTPPATVARV